MSKSAIYIANTSTQNIVVDGDINLGTVYRRFGCNLTLSGNALRVAGEGYYDIDASFVATPTAAGTITVTMLKDGIAVPGAVASATVAAEDTLVNLSLNCLIRENCACCDDISNLTFKLTGTAATISNVAIVAEKL